MDADGIFFDSPSSERFSRHQRYSAEDLLKYFPRLEEIASKTLFGTDWPGPGVPDIKKNLDEFRTLPLSDGVQDQILSRSPGSVWVISVGSTLESEHVMKRARGACF